MSELKIKVDPEIELALIRNITNSIVNMAEDAKCTIMDFAAVAVEAYKVLDPFLKARDRYLNKEVMRKALLNPYFDNEIDVILVNKADATSVKFNQIDVGIRVQYSTDLPDDEYYAIGVETEETLRHTDEEYLGVPFVNIYYHQDALATGK